MKALLIKDVKIQIPTMIFGAVYPLLLLLLFRLIDDGGYNVRFVFLLCTVVIPYMLTMGSFKEAKNNSERFILALPVLRRDIVNGKFLFLLMTALGALLVTLVTMELIILLTRPQSVYRIALRDLIPVASGLMMFTFLFPLYFRFGFKAMRMLLIGVMIFGVVLQLFLVMASFLGDRSFFELIDAVVEWRQRLGFYRWNLSVAGAAAVIFGASFFASHRIVGRMDY